MKTIRWSCITLVVWLCSLLPASSSVCTWDAGTSHVTWNGIHCLRLHDDNYRLYGQQTARDNCKQCLLVMAPNATSCSARPGCIFTGGLACRFVG